MTGDRPGTLVLDRINEDSGYAVVGDKGKVIFGGDPVEVTQVTFDGLDFYTDPGDCTITPGEHNPDAGVAWADLECSEVRDIRDKATVSVAGRVAVAANMLGLTDDLPSPGGALTVGGETWTATYGTFAAVVSRFAPQTDDAMSIGAVDDDGRTPLWHMEFSWNSETDRLALFHVGYAGEVVPASPDACVIDRRTIGKHSPRSWVIEVTLDCPSVEVPELGVVPIRGTVVVNQFNFGFH